MRSSARALFAFACAALLAREASADEVYATVDRTAAPGERALVKVRSDKGGPLTLVLFRVEEPAALLEAGIDPTHGETAYPRLKASLGEALRANPRAPAPLEGSGEASVAAHLTFVSTTGANLPAPNNQKSEATVEVALPAAGLYLVEVRGAAGATLVAALSSRLSLVTKRDPTRLLAWAVDRTSGAAIENATVEVRAAGKVLGSGRTDASGLLSLSIAGTPTLDVRGVSGDDWAFGAETYFPAGVAARRVHAFTHQPAYRPGERVEAKGIVRAVVDGQCALDADVKEAVVRFVARERELGSVKAAISADLGTFSAGLDLPKDAPTGEASIVVEIDGKSYVAPFRIEEYRRPTFEVRVVAKPDRVFPGQDLAFDVSAEFFEGGPVAAGKVSWSLAYHRVDRDLFPTDEMARLFFGTEREAYAPEPLGRGEATLDGNGRVSIAAKAPERGEDGFVTLTATVIGPDRTAVSGSGGAALHAEPLSVAMKTDKHLYGAEGVAHVTIRAVSADGSPAAAREGLLTAALLVERPRSAPAGVEERQVATVPFSTGADGAATLDVPFAENGRYALSVAMPRKAPEPAGAPAAALLHVWVAGDRADVGYSGDRLEVVADKDAYEVGDTARLLVLSPAGARPFLRTIEGPRLLSWEAVRLPGADDKGAAVVVSIPVTADHVPNGFVGIAVVDHGNLMATSKMLRVPPVDRLLTVKVVAAKTELEPGETVGMRVTATDRKGAPAAGAEVAVAIVDDSLYALYSDPSAPLEPFFHPIRRNDVVTGGPLHLLSTAFSVRAEPPAKHGAARGAALGTDAGPALGGLAPGSRAGAPPPPSAPAPMPTPVERPRADPEAVPSREGGGGGGSGGGIRLLRPGSVEFGVSAAKELKKDDGGEGPLTARADFRAAIWWSPTVRVGADGTADLGPVKFAESLTRWRITARAVDGTTRVGTSVATVRTAKKLLTRVTLPRFLRANDVVDAPWVLHSLLATDEEARYVAGVTGLTLSGPATGAELLKAGAVVTHDLRLTAPAVGEGTVTAEVRAAGFGDAVTQKLPILPQGIPKAIAVTGFAENGPTTLPPLSLPKDTEPGTARLKITVAPSLVQAVGAALPYLADYPYGCTEQTMSRLVPVVVAKAARDAFHVPASKGRLAELPKMIDAGLARLRALQHADGGFGWWESDASDPYMTAYVVHGLTRVMAVADDSAPANATLDRAAKWLAAWLPGRHDAVDHEVVVGFAVMALCESGHLTAKQLRPSPPDGPPGSKGPVMNPLERAFYVRARVAARSTDGQNAYDLADISKTATRDAAGVRWEGARPGRWADDSVEKTAWILGAILAADPKNADLAPGARWLLSQRVNGDHWRSTRDTAACVAFLTRYAATTGDLGAGRTVRLSVNGVELAPVVLTPETAFSDAATVVVETGNLPRGAIEITATPETGSASVSAALTFNETGPAIQPGDSGFKVTRTFWLLAPSEKSAKGGWVRQALTETVPTGALIDVDVTVTTSEAREFVMVTSPFAAGFEPERDYGTLAYEAAPAIAAKTDHAETRDDRAVFFVKSLPAGTHVFRHRVRATHVGSFTALPAQAELMYFPEVRGNGAGEALEVSKRGPAGAAAGGK